MSIKTRSTGIPWRKRKIFSDPLKSKKNICIIFLRTYKYLSFEYNFLSLVKSIRIKFDYLATKILIYADSVTIINLNSFCFFFHFKQTTNWNDVSHISTQSSHYMKFINLVLCYANARLIIAHFPVEVTSSENKGGEKIVNMWRKCESNWQKRCKKSK